MTSIDIWQNWHKTLCHEGPQGLARSLRWLYTISSCSPTTKDTHRELRNFADRIESSQNWSSSVIFVPMVILRIFPHQTRRLPIRLVAFSERCPNIGLELPSRLKEESQVAKQSMYACATVIPIPRNIVVRIDLASNVVNNSPEVETIAHSLAHNLRSRSFLRDGSDSRVARRIGQEKCLDCMGLRVRPL
jgi:hypothetical protein